jgi:organic radical activating enzyme
MKIKVSELFYSLQGEGRFVGVPSVFLRTFGCNFTCSGFGCAPGEKSTEADDIAKNIELYKSIADVPLAKTGCDSFISWHPAYKDLSPTYENPDLVKMMLDLVPENNWLQSNGNDVHLVVTGGEPLLGWQRAYAELLELPGMINLKNLTFETNGTQDLQEKFSEYIFNRWTKPGKRNELTFSVSAKLSASGEKWEEAIRPDVVVDYQSYGHTYLKFVVETDEHFTEVDQAVSEYRAAGFYGPVFVMPIGGTVESYDNNRVRVADWALRRGYNYSPRLHVDIWKNGWAK